MIMSIGSDANEAQIEPNKKPKASRPSWSHDTDVWWWDKQRRGTILMSVYYSETFFIEFVACTNDIIHAYTFQTKYNTLINPHKMKYTIKVVWKKNQNLNIYCELKLLQTLLETTWNGYIKKEKVNAIRRKNKNEQGSLQLK